jgi:hypothetical protein
MLRVEGQSVLLPLRAGERENYRQSAGEFVTIRVIRVKDFVPFVPFPTFIHSGATSCGLAHHWLEFPPGPRHAV